MKQVGSIKEAMFAVRERFPFKGYMDRAVDSYSTLAHTVQRYLEAGDNVLDFASGPCDKTAVIQLLGFNCAAYDDLGDEWHLRGDNQRRIHEFAERMGIDFRSPSDGQLPFEEEAFEMVMAHDVLEHLHDSPRELLNDLVALVAPGGYLFVTVPNAANLRKRMALAIGRTNLPEFDAYYWSPGAWRGHVREYVRGDLERLASNLGLEIVELRSCHHMLKRLPKWARLPYRGLTRILPGGRDTWLLVARKPPGWEPRRKLEREEYERLMGRTSPYFAAD